MKLLIHKAMPIQKQFLIDHYVKKKLSSMQISRELKCSAHTVDYWIHKHNIKKRSISESQYVKKNPKGDPFSLKYPHTLSEGILYGLGIGLYWGEGLKRGKGGLRLANTDVRLIKKFIDFLEKFFGIKKQKLRFGLQIFSDISPDKALAYWKKELKVEKGQFYKIMVSKVRGVGTYTYKSEYGVLMVYFNNVRLKEVVCKMIDNI